MWCSLTELSTSFFCVIFAGTENLINFFGRYSSREYLPIIPLPHHCCCWSRQQSRQWWGSEKWKKKLKEECLTSFPPPCYFWSALKRRRRRASHRRPPFSQMTGPLCIFEAKWLFEDRSTILYHIDAMFWHEGQFSKGFLFKNYLHHVCIDYRAE